MMSKCMGNWMSYGMSNWMSDNNRVSNSVGNWRGNSFRVESDAIIGYIGNMSIIVINMVFDMLNTTIGKVDRVGTINNTSSIIRLNLVEGSIRVVISNCMLASAMGRLSQVRMSNPA